VDGGERTASDFPQVNWDPSTQGERAGAAAPGQVNAWAGVDAGKESHFAGVLDNEGERLFSRAVGNDQGATEALLDHASEHGAPAADARPPSSAPTCRPSPATRPDCSNLGPRIPGQPVHRPRPAALQAMLSQFEPA
jgi:hypothetical protein